MSKFSRFIYNLKFKLMIIQSRFRPIQKDEDPPEFIYEGDDE